MNNPYERAKKISKKMKKKWKDKEYREHMSKVNSENSKKRKHFGRRKKDDEDLCEGEGEI